MSAQNVLEMNPCREDDLGGIAEKNDFPGVS
jgi:hypothetical protein